MLAKFGLQETPFDERDYQLGAITLLPDLDTLPEQYEIDVQVKNQGDTDYCSAYMSCAMSEPQEGVVLVPEYSFALSKKLSGDVDAWGQNIRDALKAHIKFGAIEDGHTIPDDPRNIDNWDDDLYHRAYEHRKKTFFKVTGQYDHFDNARAALYKFKSPIGTGVQFGWPLQKHNLDTIPTGGYGHAVTIVGFTPNYLILQNSYGTDAGIGGKHYISRDVYNHFAERYGHYMFIDIPREDVEYNMEYNIHIGDNWLVQLWKVIKSLIYKFVCQKHILVRSLPW